MIWLLISPPGVASEDYCDNHQGHQGQGLQEVAVITRKMRQNECPRPPSCKSRGENNVINSGQ